jgi:molybdate transport system substrate-binding protein
MRRLLIALGTIALAMPAAAQDAVAVYAAGSLRAVLTELRAAYKQQSGTDVKFTFGPSGLLKERIEKGEPADVFASANVEHPAAIAKAGLANPPRVFTRNEMCGLVSPKVKATPANLLDLMLDPAIKLGTSTPKADPSGDYAWLAFERAEKARPGSMTKLDAKALKLTGGKDSPAPKPNRNQYTEMVADGKADIFLTYCTNAVLAIKDEPALQRVALPADLSVGADYGLAVLKRAGPTAQAFADHLLSAEAQRIFATHGFMPVAR